MLELKRPEPISIIATSMSLRSSQVGAAIRLLDEGNTIPFIARYRKEMTGELDENQLREIASRYETHQALYQRKCDVIRLLGEQGIFEDPETQQRLMTAIEAAASLTEVDDIYRPYRPKRKTRASVAKERGLEPLADWLKDPENVIEPEASVRRQAEQYVSEEIGVPSADDALQGAADILAEEVADNAEIRKWLRGYTLSNASIRSTAVDKDAESVYELYYDYQEPLTKVLPHRILAMNRGEREEFLRVSIVVPQDNLFSTLEQRAIKALSGTHSVTGPSTGSYVFSLLQSITADAYKRLLAPAIEREIRAELTGQAELHAIHIFGENLRNLLMQQPIRGKTVLGVDPAYRTGCKLAAIDDTGKLLETAVVYPTPPQNKMEAAQETILSLIQKYEVDVIAIGNGTASRETESFIADCVKAVQLQSQRIVPYLIVSEAGASVYSASKLAGEEFPGLDVSERSAISIARRIQDPLAELVKIDPKSVGVGQYQHDVSQKELDQKLVSVVESAVNLVGVDVNTASPSLLSYVSGLNKTVAKNIVDYRDANGRFKDRKMLANVPRLGPKTLEQCIGFLRVTDGENALDATPIHPESYPAVHALVNQFGTVSGFFSDPETRTQLIQTLRSVPETSLAADIGVGVPTLRDILAALERPGRDPREDVPAPILRTDVMKLEDLQIGMILTGTVRNVVDFGAFVDIGIKNDGLVHISQLADRFVKHPMDVVSVGDIVRVRVIQVDANKGRVGLSMKGIS